MIKIWNSLHGRWFGKGRWTLHSGRINFVNSELNITSDSLWHFWNLPCFLCGCSFACPHCLPDFSDDNRGLIPDPPCLFNRMACPDDVFPWMSLSSCDNSYAMKEHIRRTRMCSFIYLLKRDLLINAKICRAHWIYFSQMNFVILMNSMTFRKENRRCAILPMSCPERRKLLQLHCDFDLFWH